jgi:RHS repeat-associated protein
LCTLTASTDPEGNERRFEYDAAGHLTARINPEGGTYRYIYDDEGRVAAEIDELGYQISYNYNMDARVTAKTDRLGRDTIYYFNENNRLTRTVYPDGSEVRYEYDDQNNRTLVVDELGLATRTAYNTNNDPVQITDPRGNITQITYEPQFNKVSSTTDALGRTTTMSYDQYGNLTTITHPDGAVSTIAYNDQGLPVSRTDENGHTTLLRYNEYGDLAELEHPDDEIITYTTDLVGRLTAVTDETGNTTSFSYNNRDSLIQTTDPTGVVTTHEYDSLQRRVATVDGRGHRTEFVYDGRGDVLEQINALGNTTAFVYDGERNLIRRTHANTTGVELQRDQRFRVVRETTFPANRVTAYTYDLKGRRIATTDAAGVVTSATYDELSRVITATDGDGHITTYDYDSVGNLTAVTDANTHTTAYTYDARNRRLSETNPLGQATSFTYDSAGNLLTRQKPDGATIEYVYDTRNRRTETRYPDGTAETATYDAAGRMIGMGNATTSETTTYDANGRPVSVTDQHMGAISYTYDAVGNRTSVTDPDGGIQRFVYDELNRLSSVTDPTGGVTSYQYDELNRPIRTTLPNGVTTSRGYDDDNRLQQVRTVDPAGTVLALFDYTYDAVGNRTTMTEEDGGATSYTYDNRYQVIEVDYPEGRVANATGAGEIKPLPGFERFIYDPVGNRLSRQTDTTTTTYEYDAANRMTRGGDAIYRYDANGNRVAKEDAGLYRYHTEHPDVSYQYDYEDRLIRIVEQQLHPTNRTAHGEDLPAGLSRKPALQFVTEYRYDAAGRRVEKHTGPSFNGMLEGTIDDVRFEQVRYLYDGLEVLHEHSSRQDHQTKAFYRAGGRLVAQFRYATSDGFGSGQIPRMYLDYYSHDGLGSVATLTHYEDDENHQPIRYRYSAFGAIVQGDFTNNPYGYTSRRFDHENGFYHYHFRKYDPVTGNWLTPDPIGIGGGINLYRFVQNNPVNFVEWLGLYSSMGEGYGGDLGGGDEVEGPGSHHDPTPGDLRDGGYGWDANNGGWGFFEGQGSFQSTTVNHSRFTIKVLGEHGITVSVPPGGFYRGPIDGFTGPNRRGGFDVVKTRSIFGKFSITISDHGYNLPGPDWGNDAIGGGVKDRDWLEERHNQNPPDESWDELFEHCEQ